MFFKDLTEMLLNREINSKCNNWEFTGMTKNQMKEIDMLLNLAKYSNIIRYDYTFHQLKNTNEVKNIVIDCEKNLPNEILDDKQIKKNLSDAVTHVTYHLLNFQSIEDKDILIKINNLILNINKGSYSFFIYHDMPCLKTYETGSEKQYALDIRDDLSLEKIIKDIGIEAV